MASAPGFRRQAFIQNAPDSQVCGFSSGLYSEALIPDAAEAEQGIPFGFADHRALAAHCNCADHLEAEEEMKREEEPE